VRYWFTSDHHNLHKSIIENCGRPFENVKEQQQCLLDNHNSLVKPGDTVHILGDIAMKKEGAISLLEKMNGQKYFVLGNHDRKFINEIKKYCINVRVIRDIKINGQKITLCHYAMRVWNCSHHGAWELYGHSHGTLPPLGKSYDVGVDNNNFKPVSFEEIVEVMKTLRQHHIIKNGEESYV